jgi:hypothetical protein
VLRWVRCVVVLLLPAACSYPPLNGPVCYGAAPCTVCLAAQDGPGAGGGGGGGAGLIKGPPASLGPNVSPAATP